ncbi:5'-3' exonuclease [Mesomycoplasma neurolyticum]|uniref:5'-3' exonuclease n=1 Tax=Mesomycoplasma neurolyticum TaxID=2120 RepID=A0A449A620_9BACT|nr:5'-3' exonuclease [Mesomycoplasma neurolyticum]VEU59705.1 probable 5'-3' exodeoxyribonuclease [Mesomycoplasma neurolyticum]
MKNRILLIDANLLLFKSFYASSGTKYTLMKSDSGIPTYAINTFFYSLFNVIEIMNPTHIYLAFDSKEKTYRHNLNSDYKANRKSPPEELLIQFDWIKKILKKLQIVYENIPHFEADDLIATFSNKLKDNNEIIVWSDDKDLLQLVSENVSILCKVKNNFLLKNIENFEKLENLKPTQIVDFKAIAGDNSDNLKGVVGIGEITAKKLLLQYQTLDNIYASLDKLSASIQNKFIESKKNAYLCKKITELLFNAPSKHNLNSIKLNISFSDDAQKILSYLNLKKLIFRIRKFIDDSNNR